MAEMPITKKLMELAAEIAARARIARGQVQRLEQVRVFQRPLDRLHERLLRALQRGLLDRESLDGRIWWAGWQLTHVATAVSPCPRSR